MPRSTWIIASLLSLTVVIAVLAFSAWQKSVDLDRATLELAEARATNENFVAELTSIRGELNSSKARVEELQKENEKANLAQKSLEQEMRSALESKDITISELQGKLTVNILDRVLFDSGEAELKPEGEKVIQKIATVLAQYPDRQIHVIGHTDNVPIRIGPRTKFASNWELSTARAIAAVRFLCEKAGADPRRLGAVGYGEFHPVADNATAEGRAKNRRIALVVLPEDLSDAERKQQIATTPVPVKSPLEAVTTSEDKVAGK